MKKYSFMAAALLVIASACQTKNENAAAGIPDDSTGDMSIPIQLGTNVRTSGTKAPVEAWAGQDLYVFGYERIPYTASHPASLAQAYIDGVKASAPASGTSGSIELLDGDGLPFYYGYKNNAYLAYDFYACYISDAAVAADIVKSETTIFVPFVIDGTQDLMIAAANREGDTKDSNGDQIVPVEYAYSGYSARSHDVNDAGRFVTPNLLFRHCLTRFDFTIQNCSTTGTFLKIGAFSLSSITEGQLVVADIAGGVTGVVANPGATVDNLAVALPAGGIDLNPDRSEHIVGSMMVIPADSHTINIDFKQLVEDPIFKENLHVSYDIRPGDVIAPDGEPVTEFKVGYKYNVLIKIYGLEKIEVKVELEPWSDGGDVTIDPDDFPWGYENA